MISMIKPRGGYIYILINGFNYIDNDATRWLCILIYIYICILYNDVMRCHKDTVMLRSTTDPYGRPVLEVAYREFSYFTPPRLYGSG